MNLDSPEFEPDVRRQAAFRRALLDAQSDLGEGIAIVDREAERFVYANEALGRLLGYELAELLALESYYALLPAAQRAVLAARRRTTQQGLPLITGVELEVPRRDGTSVSVEVSAKSLSELPGDQALVLVRDITERRRAEQRLRLLESAIEQAQETVLITTADLDGPGPEIIYASPAVTAMTGFTPEELRGRSPRVFQGPKTDRALLDRFRARVAAGESFSGEIVNYRKDGTEFDLAWDVAPVRDDDGRVTNFVAIQRDVTERNRRETAVRRLAEIVESSEDAILSADAEGRLTSWNIGAERMTGYAASEVLGRDVELLVPPDASGEAHRILSTLIRGDSLQSFETTGLAKDGRLIDVSIAVFPIRDSGGEIVGVSGIARDIGGRLAAERERAELEARLRQSERLETVGLLAGGIAHDFNNLLAVILNYADFMRRELDGDDRVRDDLEEIRGAAERAAALTRQLLAFSRREIVDPEILDLNEVVGETERLLRRMIGEDIELLSELTPDPWPIKADRGQIEQIIMNLVINARDAMSGRGGVVRIETANARIGAERPAETGDLAPGPYVRLTVVDDGRGMDEAQRLRAFEPFFSTKPQDEGSGLGLATVYGIARQSGGHAALESTPDRGSRITVHLPATEDAPAEGPTVPSAHPLRGTGQTILLVEDEDSVREVTRRILADAGYEVVEAGEGRAAIELFDDSIDLLVTDVVLPRMSGTELAERLQAGHPALRVLYISGYTDDVVLRAGVERGRVPFVQKPFTAELLRRRVHAVLEGEMEGSEARTPPSQLSR